LAVECTIVYADLGLSVPQSPSVLAQTLVQQSREGAAAGNIRIVSRSLSTADVVGAIRAMPSGHDRLSMDSILVLLDAGAMLAHAPYRARVLLTDDPFESVDGLAQTLQIDANTLRIRLHDALLSAEKIVTISGAAFDAVTPLISHRPEPRVSPPIALQVSNAEQAPILVVNNDGEGALADLMTILRDAFPMQEFQVFDPATVFDRSWKAVLHIGIARSSRSGARLNDAWAGGVPVLQLVDQASLIAQHRRNPGSLLELVVEHGRTGLMFTFVDELIYALGDLLIDPLPLRSVARGARRRIDPAAQWNSLLKALLQ
jgi:hypothetical protein